ncbi:MAG: DUF2851 family protein [Dehalococcoidia bacterium]
MERITEKNVAGLWRSGLISGLEDDLGNDIQVIHPGRGSTGAGCDFQDAVIEMNGERIVGDVEIHVTSDLWLKHRHNVNPLYNGIILHAAMWQRGGLPVKLHNGRTIPTVILHKFIPGQAADIRLTSNMPAPGCPHSRRPAIRTKLHRILARAGRQRFIQKSETFSTSLCTSDASQVLYKAICRALGYFRNAAPFEELAGILPFSLLEKYAVCDPLTRQACLFGAAGLLPSQGPDMGICTDEEESAMEGRWLDVRLPVSPMAGGKWTHSCIRPGNSPLKRLAGLSYLLNRFEDTGVLAGLSLLIATAPLKQASLILGNCLTVKGDGYWAWHHDFGRSHEHATALIGRGRAGEIAVNAVLPFFHALAHGEGDESLERKISAVYRGHKELPGNELTRYMRHELSIEGSGGLTACLQQGLLHIYHSWCRVKECQSCPVFTGRMPDRV